MEKPKSKKSKSKVKKVPLRIAPTLGEYLRLASFTTRQSQNSIIEDAIAVALGVGNREAEVRLKAAQKAVNSPSTHDAIVAAIKREEEAEGLK